MSTSYGEAGALAARAGSELCTVIGPASAIVGGKLFYAMGTYTFSDGNILVRQPKLFSIDLHNGFHAHSLLSDYEAIDLPNGVPYQDDDGMFLYTNTTLYFYAPSLDSTNGTEIWTYDVENQEFNKLDVEGGENVPHQIYPGGYASDPANGMMYYTGSYRDSQKRRKRKRGESGLVERAPERPWLQMLDASRPGEEKWLEGAGDGPTLLYGTLQYVRYGEKGILVGFGGVDPDDDTQFADSDVAGYRTMTDIFIFDLDTEEWHTVKATGGRSSRDIPDGRLNFCAGVSYAPDDTSAQIVIYGGYKLSNVAAVNKVHVLTLPTFQWLEVTPWGNEFGDQEWGRQGPRCTMWNDAQMIVLGGQIQGNTSRDDTVMNTGSCAPEHPPVLVLDTTTFEWLEEFNPNRSYSQPKVVYELIGGDWRGLNSKKGPSRGFSSSALSSIFATTVKRIDQPTAFAAISTGPDNPDPTTPPPTDGEQSSSKPNTGAIVGGAIGGTIVLIVLGLLIFYLRRRRQKNEPDVPFIPGHSVAVPADRFEKPELDGTIPAPVPPSYPGLHQTHKAELPDRSTEVLIELPANQGETTGTSNPVYELDSSGSNNSVGQRMPVRKPTR